MVAMFGAPKAVNTSACVVSPRRNLSCTAPWVKSARASGDCDDFGDSLAQPAAIRIAAKLKR
jgi:hypothetical protein